SPMVVPLLLVVDSAGEAGAPPTLPCVLVVSRSALTRLTRALGARRERLPEGSEGPRDLVIAVGERDVELLGGLDDAALDQLVSEGGVEGAVGGERRPVVGHRAVGEVDLEDRRLAGHPGADAGGIGGLLEAVLDPGPRREEPLIRPRLPELG